MHFCVICSAEGRPHTTLRSEMPRSRIGSILPHMSELDLVLVGKYSGCSHAAVAEADRSYCNWVMTTRSSIPRSLLPFRLWLKRTKGGVLPYGKYKNSFFSDVFEDHPEYGVWALVVHARRCSADRSVPCYPYCQCCHMALAARACLVCELGDPSAAMLEFQKYVRERQERAVSKEARQPAPKRARESPDQRQAPRTAPCLECKICFDRPINVLLVPCRHLVLCETCAALTATCPVCRGRVSQTLRVYLG